MPAAYYSVTPLATRARRVLIVAAAALGLGWPRLREARPSVLPALLSTTIAVLLASALATAWPTVAAAPSPDDSAYSAALWSLVGLTIAITLVAAGIAAFALARLVIGHGPRTRPPLPRFLMLWTASASVTGLVTWAIVQGGPGLLP